MIYKVNHNFIRNIAILFPPNRAVLGYTAQLVFKGHRTCSPKCLHQKSESLYYSVRAWRHFMAPIRLHSNVSVFCDLWRLWLNCLWSKWHSVMLQHWSDDHYNLWGFQTRPGIRHKATNPTAEDTSAEQSGWFTAIRANLWVTWCSTGTSATVLFTVTGQIFLWMHV